MPHTPLVIGHRGACAFLPENTLPSFQMALEEAEADMIEFDVHATKDGVPVIIHDANLKRTTDGKGYVSQFRYEELTHFDAGFCFKPLDHFPYRGKEIRIPTLEQIFQRFPRHGLSIEIKERSRELTRSVMLLVKKYQAEGRVIVGSKHDAVSQEMRKNYPHVPRFCSQNDVLRCWLEYQSRKSNPEKDSAAVASIPLQSCSMHFYERDFINYLHKKEMKVFYWTINDPERMRSLAESGADGIITDDPFLGRKIIARKS